MSKSADLMALRADLLSALARVNQLMQVSGHATETGFVDLDRTVAIETVLRRAAVPMRPVEIWASLQEYGRMSDPKMQVQVTTYDLWKRGRIDKVGRGQYVAKALDAGGR